MSSRRRREKRNDGRRLTPAEIDELTDTAGELLEELHAVLKEMSDRLIELAAGDQ